jgi:hypothetical protein
VKIITIKEAKDVPKNCQEKRVESRDVDRLYRGDAFGRREIAERSHHKIGKGKEKSGHESAAKRREKVGGQKQVVHKVYLGANVQSAHA